MAKEWDSVATSAAEAAWWHSMDKIDESTWWQQQLPLTENEGGGFWAKKNPEEITITAAVLSGLRYLGEAKTMEILATWLMAHHRQTNPTGITEYENESGCKVLVFNTGVATVKYK